MNENQKPNLVPLIGVTTLISGLVNLFWGLILSAHAIGTVIGVICVPITILPAVLGIFEIIYSTKVLSTPPQRVLPSTSLAVFEIACFFVGNVFAAAVGILALIFYNDSLVKNYFMQLNKKDETPLPASPTPVPPQPADPTPELLPSESQPKPPRKLA